MSADTSYVRTSNKVWYRSPATIKTHRDIIRLWVNHGYTYAADNDEPSPQRKAVQARGTKLYWNDVLVAEHFEPETIIYANRDKSVHNIIRTLRDVMLNEAGWEEKPTSKKPPAHLEPAPDEKQGDTGTTTEDQLAAIFSNIGAY